MNYQRRSYYVIHKLSKKLSAEPTGDCLRQKWLKNLHSRKKYNFIFTSSLLYMYNQTMHVSQGYGVTHKMGDEY